MNTYKIEIQETLSRTIEIEASSAEEAIDKVKEMYRAEEIVLGGDGWVATEIDERMVFPSEQTEQVTVQVTDQVENLLSVMDKEHHININERRSIIDN